MTSERVRRMVEDVLDSQGWSVYRLILGSGPALIATRSGLDPVLVAVYRPSESRGRVYHRLDRAEGAHVLASPPTRGPVVFVDPLTASEAPNLATLVRRMRGGPQSATSPLPRGERCLPA